MTDEKEVQERAHRDRDRSEEAHWQVAEAGAEEEENRRSAAEEEEEDQGSETAPQSGEQQPEWEDEGGALARDP